MGGVISTVGDNCPLSRKRAEGPKLSRMLLSIDSISSQRRVQRKLDQLSHHQFAEYTIDREQSNLSSTLSSRKSLFYFTETDNLDGRDSYLDKFFSNKLQTLS
ncbi:hypothetical protein PUN28_018645 [Cardiocondyla obscurior]|uniref:Uncharacterized protein n=1 Tax=Cardiocondyla obscurior TaxID=286306 RepID=A0AAW2EFT5_9HYME